MITILHISDLHRDPNSTLTNKSLLESLRLDKERYLKEGLQSPDLAVVSGDIVYGVKDNDKASDSNLKAQYDEAETFLIGLADLFFEGNRELIVLVPGNHDVSHPHVLRATVPEPLPLELDKRNLLAQKLNVEGSQYRWIWSDFSLCRISNVELYNQRMAPFAFFYKSFYKGVREYSLDPTNQYVLHDFPDLGIVIAALSSCCDNDLFNRSGRIHPDCVADVTRLISPYIQKGRAPVAIWHHNLAGAPKDSDYVDAEFLQSLMDGNFVLGLHGHQHRPQFLEHRFTADKKKSIAVISAGTLCGGPYSLPSGRMRSYNIIEIDTKSCNGKVHVRDMKNTSFSMPVWGAAHVPEFSGSSMGFNISISAPSGSGDIETSEAMELLDKGEWKRAFDITQLYPCNDWARRVAVEALERMQDWSGIRSFCTPPRSNAEVVKLFEALYELQDKAAIRALLDSESILNNPDRAVQECVNRARIRLNGSK